MILIDYIMKWISIKKNLYSLGAFTLIMILLAVDFSYWAGAIEVSEIPGGDGGGPRLTDWTKWEVGEGGPIASSGLLQENSETVETVQVSEPNVISITFTLTWTDEPDQQYGPRTYQNRPDSFTLQAQAPDGTESRRVSGSNPQGESGKLIVTMDFAPDKDPFMNGTGTYNVTIELGECGDFFSNGPIGFTDTENTWELAVEYEYYYKQE